MYEAIGCSRSTFFRHLLRLDRLGYLVRIARLVTMSGNSANVYAIPGTRGALDHLRRRRIFLQMLLCTDGKRRPHVVGEGEQALLFLPESDTGVVSKWDGGSVKMTPPPCQSDAQPYPYHNPGPAQGPWEKNHGASAKRGREKKQPKPRPQGVWNSHGAPAKLDSQKQKQQKLRHVELADLKSAERLLAMHVSAVARGLVDGSEAGRLMFVAAAQHALRHGDDPCRLFAAIVNQGRWLYITGDDEMAANELIKAQLYGSSRRETSG